MPNPFDYGAGIAGFLGSSPEDMRGVGVAGTVKPKLRAVPTPTNAPPARPSGITKTDLGPMAGGISPYDELQPETGPSIGQAWQGVPFRVPGSPDYGEEPPDTHIRFGIGPGGLSDYTPGMDVAAVEPDVATSRARGFMGQPGLPGGGGFSPSQMDWSKVANPEAFDAYDDTINRNLHAAEERRSGMLAADPYADQRAEADIWKETQLGLQSGIRQQIIAEMHAAAQRIEDEVRQDPRFAAAGEPAIQEEIKRRLQNMQSEYDTAFGSRGPASTLPRSYADYPEGR